ALRPRRGSRGPTCHAAGSFFVRARRGGRGGTGASASASPSCTHDCSGCRGGLMDSAELRSLLLYSTIINYVVLIVWFVALMVARTPLYRLHTKWFKLSPGAFDAIHYGGMAVYKIGILLLNLVPLVALYLS